MRALQYIVVSFIFITIIGGIGFFIARETLLYWASKSIEKSMNQLRRAEASNSYNQECLRKGSQALSYQNKLVTLQMRFVSSTEFMLEAVCQQFTFDPLLIDRGELPPLVTKVPGTSGFTLNGDVPSAITLAVFEDYIDEATKLSGVDLSFLRRHVSYTMADTTVEVADQTKYYEPGPVTSCGGYGFQCCQTASEMGVGERIVGLTDCADQCYARCIARPILLSFASDPLINPVDRSIKVSSGTAVDFSYLADDQREGTVQAVIEFGDGARTEIPHEQGLATHTYTCSTGSCTYVASISLTDSWGVTSADTVQSRITVIVN